MAECLRESRRCGRGGDARAMTRRLLIEAGVHYPKAAASGMKAHRLRARDLYRPPMHRTAITEPAMRYKAHGGLEIAQISEMIAAGSSPVELTRECLDRIMADNAKLRAMIF